MPSIPRLIAPVLLAAGLALTATSAFAAPAYALAKANVRSGPGAGYAVVDTLTKGEYVVVISCTTNWCNIHHIGPDGWVARTLLINPYYSTRPYYQFAPKTPAPGRSAPGR